MCSGHINSIQTWPTLNRSQTVRPSMRPLCSYNYNKTIPKGIFISCCIFMASFYSTVRIWLMCHYIIHLETLSLSNLQSTAYGKNTLPLSYGVLVVLIFVLATKIDLRIVLFWQTFFCTHCTFCNVLKQVSNFFPRCPQI